jgi:hypothetical protein
MIGRLVSFSLTVQSHFVVQQLSIVNQADGAGT